MTAPKAKSKSHHREVKVTFKIVTLHYIQTLSGLSSLTYGSAQAKQR